MSLINDALKRASESDRNRPAQAAVPRIMRPVAAQRRTRISWVLAAIVVGVLGLSLAGWVFLKWWEASHPVVVAAVPAAPAPAPAPVVVQETPPPAATPAPAPAVVSAAPPAPAKPSWPIELTVKAIFYNKTSPHALVNGRTVETGDTIHGVLVTGIEPDRVLVSWNGESKELPLGDNQ